MTLLTRVLRTGSLLILLSSFSCGRQTLQPIEPPPRPPIGRAEPRSEAHADHGAAERPETAQPLAPDESVPPAEPAEPAEPGPVSSAARDVLEGLKERKFTDQDGAFGGGAWTVASFSVAPYHDGSTWTRGPHVTLTQGARSVDLPIEADGDVADLHRRVTGEAHPDLGAGMSEAYRAAIKRAGGGPTP